MGSLAAKEVRIQQSGSVLSFDLTDEKTEMKTPTDPSHY
jgi:hypothetical protein